MMSAQPPIQDGMVVLHQPGQMIAEERPSFRQRFSAECPFLDPVMGIIGCALTC